MKKRRLFLSGLSILLVLCLLAGGTMAWFTDTEKVQGDFAAGVLDITLTPGEDTAAPLAFDNLRPMTYDDFKAEINEAGNGNNNIEGYAPLPQYFQPVVIQNRGTLPVYIEVSAKALAAGEIVCAKGGEKQLVITTDEKGRETVKQVFQSDGKTNVRETCTNGLAEALKIVLFEKIGGVWTVVAENLNPGTEGAPYAPGVVIPAATGERTYVVGAYLPEDTGNKYQAKHFHGNIVVKAFQTDEGAGAPETPDKINVQWVTEDGTAVGSYQVDFPEGQEQTSIIPDPTKLPKDYVLAYKPTEIVITTVYKTNPVASFKVKRPGDNSGTDENNPIWIETAEDLDNIRNASDKFYKLGKTIDLSGVENWLPVLRFTGVLDGNGHAITGLKINQPEGRGIGLFNALSDAEVRDLTIQNPDVTAHSAGALAGSIEGTKLSGCKILGGTVQGKSAAGGLTASASGESLVENCTVTGNVRVHMDTGAGFAQGGGLLGDFQTGVTLTGCTFSGALTSDGESLHAVALGGLAGRGAGGTITGCKVTGEVINSGENFSVVEIGGLIGIARSGLELRESFVTGEVRNTKEKRLSYVGGLIGKVEEGATVADCYSSGTVSSFKSVGGLIGFSRDGMSMTNCYTVSSVYGLEPSEAHPAVGGGNTAGGGAPQAVFFQTGGFYLDNVLSDGYGSRGEGVVGKTEAELKQSSTFAGWDTNVWNIVEGEYPTLKNAALTE